MAIVSRTRSYAAAPVNGTLEYFNPDGSLAAVFGSYHVPGEGTCKDITGNYGGNNGFDLSKVTRDYSTINGVDYYTGGSIRYRATNVADTVMQAGNYGHLTVNTKSPSHSELAARMNPSKPHVDLPLFLFELKDLPSLAKSVYSFGKSLPKAYELVKQAGDSLLNPTSRHNNRNVARNLAGLNLQTTYGVNPLLGDLAKLVGASEAIERRLALIRRLSNGKDVRKRVDIDTQSVTSVFSEAWNSSVINNRGTITQTTTVRKWATTRWRNLTGGVPMSSKEAEWAAIRSTLGLDLSFSQLWNALPWSWMIDWALDVGSYLDATRNSLPLQLIGGSVMTHTKTTASRAQRLLAPSGFKGGTGRYTRETKLRTALTLSVIPTGNIPILGLGQVGILASLSVAGPRAWRV